MAAYKQSSVHATGPRTALPKHPLPRSYAKLATLAELLGDPQSPIRLFVQNSFIFRQLQ